MSARIEELSGIVLQTTATGDKHSRISLFSKQFGLQSILFRKSGKRTLGAQPDLFDDLECTLSYASIGSGMPFIREWNVLRKRNFLAQDHKVFFAAAEISRLFLNNGSHILEPQPLFALLLKSLDAMEHGSPQAVRIKTLFVFAQQEGLPVKQAWLPELDIGLRKQAEVILGSRLSELKELPSRVDEILKSLTLWLNSETELKC